ncbi:hypothetical protein M3484_10085 [Pseudomonas sp. GX19020]|uniref:hypothetical protein n=1 Tax=Pseudomonas sp. GX19020 TaxID=2942277 RepID=UPI0020186DA0|nr:hypothetical protein [Pseudomonas sp. GX19020]MCL4066919.1 hypothetical protein [Pseudomonas sp. GX19020]
MRLLSVVFALLPALPVQAAWFTDNGTREAMSVLRAKPVADLSPTEREILTAANRIGWIAVPDCGWGSNAVLVTVEGQDYAVTSLHLLTGRGPGQVHCDPGLDAIFLPNASYILPDISYQSGDEAVRRMEFENRIVDLEPDPVNFTRSGAGMPWVGDWVAYRLTETVSDDIMPDFAWGAGGLRGAMPWSARQNPAGPVWVIGYDGRFEQENGWEFSWQGCEQRKTRPDNGMIYFTCDAAPGASSSLIAVMEDGRLTFQGIVTGIMDPAIGTDIPVPKSALLWNIGTQSAGIQAKLDPRSLPEPDGWRGLWR